MATGYGIQLAQEEKNKRYQEYLSLVQRVSMLDWDRNNDPEGNQAVRDRLRTLYGEFGLPDTGIGGPAGRGGSQLFSILGIESPSPRVGIGDDIRVLDRDGNVVRGGTNDYPFVDDNNNPLILSPTGVVTGNPTVGSTEGGDGPPGTTVDRLNYGTGSRGNGINTLSGLFRDRTKPRMPPMTAPTPAYNEGIQTLTNTYVPPTNVDQQAAAQRLRAGQTNVAAQNLANQQAATYADMFKPRTTADTTTEDTTDVGTGADDTSGGGDPSTDPSTDTGGSGTVISADGGVSVGPVVGGTTNAGLTAQDLIKDYIESQGITTDILTGADPELLNYINTTNIGYDPSLDMGADVSIADAMGGNDMGMGGNAQINPLTIRPFSQLPFRPQDIPLMETPIIDYMSSNNNFMNSFNPTSSGFGQMPQGFVPMGIETLPSVGGYDFSLSNKRGR